MSSKKDGHQGSWRTLPTPCLRVSKITTSQQSSFTTHFLLSFLAFLSKIPLCISISPHIRHGFPSSWPPLHAPIRNLRNARGEAERAWRRTEQDVWCIRIVGPSSTPQRRTLAASFFQEERNARASSHPMGRALPLDQPNAPPRCDLALYHRKHHQALQQRPERSRSCKPLLECFHNFS